MRRLDWAWRPVRRQRYVFATGVLCSGHNVVRRLLWSRIPVASDTRHSAPPGRSPHSPSLAYPGLGCRCVTAPPRVLGSPHAWRSGAREPLSCRVHRHMDRVPPLHTLQLPKVMFPEPHYRCPAVGHSTAPSRQRVRHRMVWKWRRRRTEPTRCAAPVLEVPDRIDSRSRSGDWLQPRILDWRCSRWARYIPSQP